MIGGEIVSKHYSKHHYLLPFTDRNYGDILTIWDRLFSTFIDINQDDIVYGVDTNMSTFDNADFKSLIKRPFK